MKKFVILFFILLSGSTLSLEYVLTLKNGIDLESSKAEIYKILGEPKSKYSEKEGSYDNGFSYDGISFDFMDHSIMVIDINDKQYPLANGVHVGMTENSGDANLDIFPEPKTDCWCRFQVKKKDI